MINKIINILAFISIVIVMDYMLKHSYIIIIILLLVIQFSFVDYANKQQSQYKVVCKNLQKLYIVSCKYKNDDKELTEILKKIEEDM